MNDQELKIENVIKGVFLFKYKKEHKDDYKGT